jgi:radical SAM superfamily enzyme YgiQ (UPF0313 family)
MVGSEFPDAVIVGGGEHISALPGLCLSQTERLYACVIGEGEDTVVELMEAIANGDDLSTVSGIAYKDKDKMSSCQYKESSGKEYK